ncbi:MAG TPA: protein-L-isoaspartate(D-aspartate) O-methyltransferase [Candidatus Eisenbacteria bacterium]|nr:protein-L-isoaspartate(D-aspartate) O-methyltransferase [Candidatus Eisenbacteria bacterium]
MLIKPLPAFWRPSLLLLLSLLGVFSAASQAQVDYAAQRQALVDEIQREARWLSDEVGKKELDAATLAAMNKVARQEFVSQDLRSVAYANRPLPIGYGQTISQPFVVAVMTDLLRLKPGDSVLEIGTGSGYQAAILAELTKRVYSIEIIPELAKDASERLKRLGYTQVETKVGDGYYGWKEHAPFDAIIVTAAPTQIPPPLVEQLKPGGRMIIPIGGRFLMQYLVLVEKDQSGKISTRELLPVQFVPLTGSH